MFKKLLLTLVIGLCCQQAYSQNYIYRGKTKYQATPRYDFNCSHCPMGGGSLMVSIARTDNGGLLLISTSTPFSQEQIAGVVLVYLADGTIITCTDKGIKDRLDGNSMALYSFTDDEMDLLVSSNIHKIRFSVKNHMMGGSESLSAVNEDDYSFNKELKYDVPQDIAGLYSDVEGEGE